MLQLVSSPGSVSFCSCLGSEPGSLLAMSGTVDGPCYQHLFLLAVFRSCGTCAPSLRALLALGLPLAPGLPALWEQQANAVPQ